MKQTFLVIILFLLCQNTLFSEPITIGETQIIHSNILNEDRKILISLPMKYKAGSEQKYPVLILLDGEKDFYNVVSSSRFFEHSKMNPGVIVVAIENTDRNRDFLYTKSTGANSGYTGQGGGADKFLDFISTELLAYINKNYPAANYKILAGHSFGGLFSIYTLLNKPDTFDAYIAASPSLWFEKRDLVLSTEKMLSKVKDLNGKSLYFAYGGKEKDIMESSQEFEKILNQIKPAGISWKSELMPEDNHGTTPLKSYYNGLSFVFSDMAFPEKLADKDLNELNSYYTALQNKYKCQIQVPNWLYQQLISRLSNENKDDEVLKVCEAILQPLKKDNPQDKEKIKYANSIYTAVYSKKEDFKKAAEYAKKTLELYPDDFEAMGALAWFEVLNGNYDNVVKLSEAAIKLAPTVAWVKTNLVHGLIFTNNLEKAKKFYDENKDLKDPDNRTFIDMVKGDFDFLKEKKIIHPDMDRLF